MHVHSAILFQFETLGQWVVYSSDVSTSTFICILHYTGVATFMNFHSPSAAARLKIRIKMYVFSMKHWLEIAVQYRELEVKSIPQVRMIMNDNENFSAADSGAYIHRRLNGMFNEKLWARAASSKRSARNFLYVQVECMQTNTTTQRTRKYLCSWWNISWFVHRNGVTTYVPMVLGKKGS